MEIALTQQQISDMKHAIGYSHDKVKRGKYEAYRNYFATGHENASWEQLFSDGLAIKRTVFEDTVYHLSAKGLSVLSGILEVAITESR